jgi:hypothetical protein
MATRASQQFSGFDEAVPADDVMGGSLQRSSTRVPAAAQAAIEIAGRAAWLAWQISAHEVNVREARHQLSGIAEDLARFGDRFPDELRAQVLAAFENAQSSATNEDLSGVANATRQIRVAMEQYHNASLV